MWQVPASCQRIEFISDLHLQPVEGATLAAWQRYLTQSTADAIVILGDLFEVWVGDDAAQTGESGTPLTDSFEALCVPILQTASRQRPLFFMHGNRDFLLGQQFAHMTGIQLLADPTLLTWQGDRDDNRHRRVLLSHGDELCLDDVAYQTFRAEVRSAAWQSDFLRKPLVERTAIARHIRAQSEAAKRAQAAQSHVDLDAHAVKDWLTACGASTLVHGHTHRPFDHDLGDGMQRIVLSDWDLSAQPPRAQVLRLDRSPGATGTVTFTRVDWV